MKEMLAIAGERGIAVLEDCAHAHGCVVGGRGAGFVGVCGSFSGQGSKTLSGQDAGWLTTTDERLADQLCSLVTCGRRVASSKVLQGDNDRMPGVVAALLRAQLLRFPEQNALRHETFARLDQICAGLPGVSPLAGQAEVQVSPTYKWAFRVHLEEWDGVTIEQLRHALEAELSCEVARIYEPLTCSPYYQPHSDRALRISDAYWQAIDPLRYSAPHAEHAYRTVLALEHASGLDRGMPLDFAEAITKLYQHRVDLRQI
jgi:dTDP-4-amino-4,6-dideoxygalactose transaminase